MPDRQRMASGIVSIAGLIAAITSAPLVEASSAAKNATSSTNAAAIE